MSIGLISAKCWLKVWNYVVLKASIKNIVSNIRFIEAYANPKMISASQLAYYFCNLCAATEFISTLSPDALGDSSLFVEHRKSLDVRKSRYSVHQ